MIRCVNIDWLELYVLEPIDEPHNAEYYRGKQLWVHEREYGTRIYNEMFTILDNYNAPLIEIRRNPKQSNMQNAVLPPNACHIRLVNRYCYSKNAVSIMRNFLNEYNLTFSRIYRIDLCMDFERFDSGDLPNSFVSRYIKGRYTKINQANLAAHGKDRWDGRDWNYIHWGSQKSPISTKLYNKSLELREVHDKPYIRQSWFNAGLITNPVSCTKLRKDGTEYSPIIWRVEFSIRSAVKNWLTYEEDGNTKKKRSIRNTLAMYDTEDKLIAMFATLQEHYFHFRHYKYGKQKWDCPRKKLFDFDTEEFGLRVEHPSQSSQPLTKENRLLRYLDFFALTHHDPNIQSAVSVIRRAIDTDEQRRLLDNPYSLIELKALQLTIGAVQKNLGSNPIEVYNYYLEQLKQCEKTY